MTDRLGLLLLSSLLVLGGCAYHAVPFTESVVGYAMVWGEPSTAIPDREREPQLTLLGFVGDGSQAACRRARETGIAQETEPLSHRAGVTTNDARAALEKARPQCVPIILIPASPPTANFAIALGRDGLNTSVIGWWWRTDFACRDLLAKNDRVEFTKLQCAPARLIRP